MLLSITRKPVGGEGRQMDARVKPLLQAGMFNFDRSVGTALFLSSGGKSILGEEVTKKALCSPNQQDLYSHCARVSEMHHAGEGEGKWSPLHQAA